jgi:hypothetical protein
VLGRPLAGDGKWRAQRDRLSRRLCSAAFLMPDKRKPFHQFKNKLIPHFRPHFRALVHWRKSLFTHARARGMMAICWHKQTDLQNEGVDR